MDNKKEQTELKATNIISLFHPKKKKKNFFFWVKKAGRHFGFLKKAGRHQKGAGRRALQKRPRQNTGCCVLNGESADVPEDIVVDWSLRYPRSATATPRKPFPVSWTILLCITVDVCSGGHMLYL